MEERAKFGPWSRKVERVAVALWASFLVAILETGLFFSCIDPWRLDHVPFWLLDPSAIYGFVFFVFWVCNFSGTALTAYMLDSSHGVLARRDIEHS